MEHSGFKFKLRPSALSAQVEKQQEKSKEILQQQQQQKGQALCEPVASSTVLSSKSSICPSAADPLVSSNVARTANEPSIVATSNISTTTTAAAAAAAAAILTNNIGCTSTLSTDTLNACTPSTSIADSSSSLLSTSTVNGKNATNLTQCANDIASTNNSDREVNGAPVANNNSTPISNNEEASTAIPGFVFGQNLAERVILSPSKGNDDEVTDDPVTKNDSKSDKISQDKESSNVKSVETIDTGKTDSTTATTEISTNPVVIKPAFSSSASNCLPSGSSGTTLATASNSLNSATGNSSSKRKYEAITGEEDESNVLQIHCRLYHWEADETGASSHSWREKGRGFLKLNDKKSTETSEKFTSRLVMRTAGSLKLILNASLVSGMTFSKSSESSIRFTNHDGIYSIKGKEKDIDLLHSAVEYRMRELAKKVKADEATKCSAFSRIDGDENSDPTSQQSIDRIEARDEDESRDDESEKKEDKDDEEDDSTTSTVAREIDDGTSDSQAPVMSSSESNSQT